jgi:hypothetical protein
VELALPRLTPLAVAGQLERRVRQHFWGVSAY